MSGTGAERRDMKKEKEKVTVFKDSVLSILYEYQKGTRRPRQQKNSFTAAISEIEMLPQAPDQNWIPAGKDKPSSGELVYLTVHNEVIRGFWDKSAKRYKDIYGNILEDVTAWYRKPSPYKLYGGKR